MKKTLIIFMLAAALMAGGCSKDKSETKSTESTVSETTGMLPNLGGDIESGADGSGELPVYSAVSDADAKAAMDLVSESFDGDSTENIADGLSLRALSFGDSKAYILTADLSKCSLMASIPYGIKPDGSLQSLEGQVKVAESDGAKVLAALAANETDKATHVPKGMIISDGSVLYTAKGNDGSIFFGVYNDGKPFACTYGEYEEIYRNNVSEMVSAAHIIAKNGKAVSVAGSVYQNKTMRTGGGFSADRNTVCFVYGENINIDQLTNLLIGSGCSVAVNFNNDEELGLMCGDTLYGTNIAVGPALLVSEK